MKNWLLIFIALAVLAAAPMAVLTNVDYGGVDTYKWTGQRIGRDTQWRPFLTPNEAGTVGSDVEAGQYDYFNGTREHPQAGTDALVIDRPHVCSGEDIFFTVYYQGQPVSGANVGLYSHTNGRALIGEVTTDAHGRAIFIRQSDGGYDLHATYRDYPSALDVFYVGPCAPGFDSYRQAKTMPSAVAPQKPVSRAYASGAVRALKPITLVGGQEATEVTISYNLTSAWNSATLSDAVPSSLAGSAKALGFQSDYPTSITGAAPISLSWKLPPMQAGRTLTRSYVLLRAFSPDMLGAFGEPSIVDGKGQQLAGSRQASAAAPTASAATQSNASAPNSFPTAAALVGVNAAGLFPLALALVVLAALGLMLVWKLRARKTGPGAPKSEGS